MNKALLITTNANALRGDSYTNFRRLERSLTACATGWSPTASADDADIILFTDPTDPLLRDIRSHSVYHTHRDKVMVNCDNDVVYPLVPGLYTSLRDGRHNARWSEGGGYVKVFDHDWIVATAIQAEPRYLASFVGCFANHEIRQRLSRLNGRDFLVRDTDADAGRKNGQPAVVYEVWWHEFAQTLRDSAFILCPRGFAPSSYRIFEAMKAGRVPVIISDDWVAPVGPKWEQFSIRVGERYVGHVEGICRANAGRVVEMGRLAQSAFAEYFSVESCAANILNRCLAIKSSYRACYRCNQASAALHGLTDLPMIRRTVGSTIKKWVLGSS